MEVLRLYPPFIGGLRVATDDLVLGDYHVPKGYGVMYSYPAAHRDPSVFPDPDVFLPQRWSGVNKNDRDKMFGFGSGPHACIGRKLMWDVLLTVGRKFIEKFDWDHPQYPPEVKSLPVSRPRYLQPVQLRKRF